MSIVFVTTKVKRISRKLGFSLAVLLAVFVPVSRWDTFARSSLWEHFLRYFQVQVVGASPPKPGKTGGYCLRHRTSWYRSLLLGVAAVRVPGLLPLSTHHHRLCSPIYTIILTYAVLRGAVEATTTEMGKVLQSGGSIGVTPGGIAEMYLGYPQPGCAPDEEFSMLRNRKGFVRLALQHGSTLVPVFCFGASSIFSRIVLPAWIEDLSRRSSYLHNALLW